MRRSFAIAATLAAATLVSACASEPLPGEEGYEDPAISTAEHSLIGYTPNVGLAGIVLITIQGDPVSHTGMLVAPDIVVTSKDFLNPRPSASRVAVEVGVDFTHTNGTVFSVAQIMHHPGARLAYLRLNGAVAGNRTPTSSDSCTVFACMKRTLVLFSSTPFTTRIEETTPR